MRTLLLAILGALIGGAYEAFQTIELLRTGAYSLAQGGGIILAGAIVGGVLLPAASVGYRMFAARRRR